MGVASIDASTGSSLLVFTVRWCTSLAINILYMHGKLYCFICGCEGTPPITANGHFPSSGADAWYKIVQNTCNSLKFLCVRMHLMHWLLILKILATPLLILSHTFWQFKWSVLKWNINVPCSGDYKESCVFSCRYAQDGWGQLWVDHMPLEVQNKVNSLTHRDVLEHKQLIVIMPSNQSSITCSIMLNLSSAFIDVDFLTDHLVY